MPPTRKPVLVTATDLDEAGHGVGELDGRTWHVADLCPGETAEVQAHHASPHRAETWARVVRRVGEPSPDRVAPACPASGRCGGCAWQHLAYPLQLRHKRARVAAALAGLAEVAAPVPSPAPLGYRHKGKYVVGAVGRHLVLGAWAPRTHTLVDTSGCRVVAPLIDELRDRVRIAAVAAGLLPWDERLRIGALRYVIIRATRDGRALVVLVTRHDAPADLVAAVATSVATDLRVVGVVRVDNDRDDGALLDGDGRALVGAATLGDTIAGVAVELGAGEFAQINPDQADAMYDRVAALAVTAPGVRVADVYAGLGGISFALAQAGAQVVAIERDASAVAALIRAAAAAGLADRIDARTGDARTLADVGAVDVVVVNPPRKGLAPEVVAAIIAGPARRVVYVSCGPESLGRDLALLADAGFVADTAEPYDLMPGTPQIETIVRLERPAPATA